MFLTTNDHGESSNASPPPTTTAGVQSTPLTPAAPVSNPGLAQLVPPSFWKDCAYRPSPMRQHFIPPSVFRPAFFPIAGRSPCLRTDPRSPRPTRLSSNSTRRSNGTRASTTPSSSAAKAPSSIARSNPASRSSFTSWRPGRRLWTHAVWASSHPSFDPARPAPRASPAVCPGITKSARQADARSTGRRGLLDQHEPLPGATAPCPLRRPARVRCRAGAKHARRGDRDTESASYRAWSHSRGRHTGSPARRP